LRFDLQTEKARVLDRNRLRQNSGLPGLDMGVELRRASNAHRQRQWEAFLDQHRALYCRVIRRAVHRYRVRNGLPENWHPTFIQGMGLQTQMRRLFATRFRDWRRQQP